MARIRSGISKLVFEGVLDRKAGVGTRVSSRHLESGITAWRSFTREMAAKGITVQTFRLDYRMAQAPEQAASSLQVAPKTQVWRLERVRGWNNTPILLSISWFHPRLSLKGTEDFTKPLYEVIETATAVRPNHAREEFLAIQSTAAHCELLHIARGTPLLLRQHTVFDPGNRPIEFAEVRYVSSRFPLTLDLHQDKDGLRK